MAQREESLRFMDEKDPEQWTDAEWDAYEAYVASLPEGDEGYDNTVLRERYARLRGDRSGAPVVVDEGEPEDLLARLRAARLFIDDEE